MAKIGKTYKATCGQCNHACENMNPFIDNKYLCSNPKSGFFAQVIQGSKNACEFFEYRYYNYAKQ